MPIRPTRVADPTFAAASVYRAEDPSADDLAARLTRYAVLAHEPAVREVAADYWLHSEAFYGAVMTKLAASVEGEPVASSALESVAKQPADTVAERLLERELTSLLARRPELGSLSTRALDAADDNVYIGYLRGAEHRSEAPPVEVPGLWERAREMPPPSAAGREELLVVIPFMDRGGTGRLRNLLACLLALRDQSVPTERYRVTVVEFDTYPRWQHVVEPLVDNYLHVRGDGLFNKSWALNVGVRRTPGRPRVLCLLDADIIADRYFVERNLARFDDRDHDAHLPHTEMLSLDPGSTDRLIEQRCYAGATDAPLSMARGLLLRDVPGACLWIRSELFHRIGGFDERYTGWGGEDEDMIVRAARAGATVQFDDVLVHLAHSRPAMRRADGMPFNGHLEVGSWTGRSGFGELTGPSAGGRHQ